MYLTIKKRFFTVNIKKSRNAKKKVVPKQKSIARQILKIESVGQCFFAPKK